MRRTADLNTQITEEGRATSDDASEFLHFLRSGQHDPDSLTRRAAGHPVHGETQVKTAKKHFKLCLSSLNTAQ